MKGSRPIQAALTKDTDLSKTAATKAVIESMVDGLNDHRISDIGDFFSATFRWMGNQGCGTKSGLKEFQNNWQQPFQAAFSDKVCIDEARLYMGEWAAAFGRQEALHSGEFMGVPASGKKVEIRYMDFWKVVDGKINFNDNFGNKVSLNFNEFLEYIKSQSRENMEEHWRNQSDFLHYEHYDDYFSLELFSDAIGILKSKGFKVYDTRKILNHDISSFEKVDGDFSKIKDIDIEKMKNDGHVPSYKSMFTELEVNLVNEIYGDDIDLYKSHFGNSALLFK